jgi:hypothetical protein
LVCVSLRHGTAHASLGADEVLELVITKVRQRWPDVDIEVRADSGFEMPLMYEVCERMNVRYTFGIAVNPRLKAASDALLEQVIRQYAQTGQKQRQFIVVPYPVKGWDRERTVVFKAECHVAGTNRRAVVTNRPGVLIVPQGVVRRLRPARRKR